MRKLMILISGLLLLAVGCGSSADGADKGAKTSTTSPSANATTTAADPASDDPTDLAVETVPTTEASGSEESTATGKILMLKLQVGDAAEAQAFYGTVFGAKPAAQMGGGITIMTFPGEGPGLVLIPSDDESQDVGAFIIQVPDLEAAKALAIENGATEQKSFTGKPGGQAAKSVDLLDPWGNQVEILQLG